MKDQIKTGVLWLIIGPLVLVVFIDTWGRVNARYASEGLVTEMMMAMIMAGIPSIGLAGIVYVAVNYLFSLEAPKRARPVAQAAPIETTATTEGQPSPKADAKPAPAPVAHDD